MMFDVFPIKSFLYFGDFPACHAWWNRRVSFCDVLWHLGETTCLGQQLHIFSLVICRWSLNILQHLSTLCKPVLMAFICFYMFLCIAGWIPISAYIYVACSRILKPHVCSLNHLKSMFSRVWHRLRMPLLPLDPLIDAALEAAQGRDLVLLPTISRPDEDLEIRGGQYGWIIQEGPTKR